MKPYATLVSFGTGEVFARYLQAMFATAEQYFFPGRAQLLELDTTPTWPHASLDRHTHILKHRKQILGQYVFLLDADMLFEGEVADEIVTDGVTVTLHPAMPAGTPLHLLTYERNPESVAYVPHGEGARYYPGGIIGAPRSTFLDLSREVDRMKRADKGYCPVWQDESYTNRIFIDHPPALELDERYCAWHNQAVSDARIRALNKTPDEFHWRDSRTPDHLERAPSGAFVVKGGALAA